MLFNCKACGAALKKPDINFDTGIATCAHCQAVMSFSEELKISAERQAQVREKRVAGKPESLQVKNTPLRLSISRRWFHPGLFFLLFFAIAWNAFLVAWYTIGLSMAGDMGAFSIIMFVFPICHVAVGVGLAYTVAAGFLNRTKIEATASELSVRNGPVPWKGNRTVPASRVKQLFCKSAPFRLRPAQLPTASLPIGKCQLHAVLHDDTHVKLLGRIDDVESLLYIERQLEERLGIKDAPVPGEYSG